MDEPVAKSASRPTMAFERSDWLLLLTLLLLAGGMRVWLLTHTEVASRDSIGFIRIALSFETTPWKQVVSSNHQHPLYPVSVLLASWPVRWWQGDDVLDPEEMRLSAQLASSFAGLLLVVPMYLLGRRFFSRSVGFWAALVFQILPASGQILSDGLSEALYLLLATTGLLFATQAIERGSWVRYALCGFFAGLAYLTRPEGGLLVLAVLLVLFILQTRSEWRLPWRSLALRAGALFVAAAIAGSPYLIATGRLTIKPSAQQIIGKEVTAAPINAGPLFGVVLPTTGPLPQRLVKALFGLGTELVSGFHYVAWLPALLGMWWYRKRVWKTPGMLVLVMLCMIHLLLLWRLGLAAGYISDRHTMMLVLCGLFPAVAALHEIPGRILTLMREGWSTTKSQSTWPLFQRASFASLILLLALAGFAMPRTVRPLHGNRAGHHAAGRWLAENFAPGDLIEDDHCWAHYYAGCVFREGQKEPSPLPTEARRYIVIGRKTERESHPSALPRLVTEEKLREDGGQVVFHWPENRDAHRADVVVYSLPRAAKR